MPLRDLEYYTYAYRRQYEKIREKYPERKGLKGNEFLSHMKKTDKLIPVVTIVIYYGDEPWDGAKSLHEMLEMPEELKPFVNDYKMNLVEVRNAKLLFHNKNNKDLFNLLQVVYNKSEAGETKRQRAVQYAEENAVDNSVLMAIGSTSGIDVKSLEREDADMCTLFEEIKAEGREEGRVREIIETGHEFKMDENTIMKRIQEKLQISALKAEEYYAEFGKQNV